MRKDDVELKIELLTRGARVSEEGWDEYKRYKHVESSPYLIRKEDSRWVLYKDAEMLREISVSPRPAFYDMKTSEGVDMWKVFHVCGNDCLLTGVRQSCIYMKGGGQFKFCGT